MQREENYMKIIRHIPLLVFLFFTAIHGFDLFPPPRIMVDKGATWPLTDQTQIVIGNRATPSDSFAAYILSLDVKLFSGFTPEIVRENAVTAVKGNRIVIGQPGRDTLLARLCSEAGLTLHDSVLKQDTFGYKKVEGYEIDCGEDILIAAVSDQGVFYGTKTLFQLMDTGAVVHKIRATDWPHLAIRGHMIDPGRASYTINFTKRLIRLYSRIKLNTFHIHLYDDQLMGIKFNKLPLGSENPTAWTLEELKDIIQYAKKFHIEVIPELETIAHSRSILYWYKDLAACRPIGSCTGISETINTLDPRSFWLYEHMFDEIFPLIQSGFIHVGTDESKNPAPRGFVMSRLQQIVNKLNQRYGKNVKMIHWVEGAHTPDSLAENVYANTWYYSHFREDQGPWPDQDSLIRFGKQKVIAGAAGWAGPWINSYHWVSKYKNEPNFIGLIASHWVDNITDLKHDLWMSAATYSWNCDADSNMDTGQWSPLKWRYEELQMPETRYYDNRSETLLFEGADPFGTDDDYFRFSFWHPEDPLYNDTLGWVNAQYSGSG
jgi:hypothetical protein